MSAARRTGARAAAPTAKPAAIVLDQDRWADAAAVLLTLTILGTAIVVDPSAAASFDAPKRCVAMLGIAGASSCLIAGGGMRLPRRLVRSQLLVLIASILALGGAGAATLASPHRAIAADGLLTLAMFAVAALLGASRAVAGERRVWLLVALISAAVVNALASLLQVGGLALFATVAFTGRSDTGAFLGNEGVLAQATAFALVATLIAAWRAPRGAGRAAAIAACVLFLVTLLANRNLTSLVTAAAGIVVALVVTHGRRAFGPLVAAGVVVAVGVVAYAPMRTRLVEATRAGATGDWDALTTYRLGPWSAAYEMMRERPLVGFGPGTFGAEFATHRVRAELRQQRRLTIPLPTSSFVEAHSEYLQAAAEWGIPAAWAAMIAAAALLVMLARIATDDVDPRAGEALLLVGVLSAAALASLTWFPFQRPVTAVPLLLVAGRGWRLLGPSDAGVAAAPRRSWPLALAGILWFGLVMAPELARLTADRALATVTATLERIVAGGRVVPESRPLLTELALRALSAAAHDPADTRGLVAAGTAMLIAGDTGAARSHYREALGRGERAEIDLNLARAYALDGRRDDAEAALLRAIWLSPALLDALPSADRARLAATLADLEDRLRRGELAAAPPAPSGE